MIFSLSPSSKDLSSETPFRSSTTYFAGSGGQNLSGYVSGLIPGNLWIRVLSSSNHSISMLKPTSFIQKHSVPGRSNINNMPSFSSKPGFPANPLLRNSGVSATSKLNELLFMLAWTICTSCPGAKTYKRYQVSAPIIISPAIPTDTNHSWPLGTDFITFLFTFGVLFNVINYFSGHILSGYAFYTQARAGVNFQN